jgi:hypothetical protein
MINVSSQDSTGIGGNLTNIKVDYHVKNAIQRYIYRTPVGGYVSPS